MNKYIVSAFRDFLCTFFHNTSQAGKGFYRERKHQVKRYSVIGAAHTIARC